MAEKNRGFASMAKDKQRAIASKGGKAAHQKGSAHRFTPEEARAAGRKGGKAAHAKQTEEPTSEGPQQLDRETAPPQLGEGWTPGAEGRQLVE
jgi:uncharacterized protein